MCDTHYREMRLHQLRSQKPAKPTPDPKEAQKVGVVLKKLLVGETAVIKDVSQKKVTSYTYYYKKNYQRRFATHQIAGRNEVTVTRLK